MKHGSSGIASDASCSAQHALAFSRTACRSLIGCVLVACAAQAHCCSPMSPLLRPQRVPRGPRFHRLEHGAGR